jgi:hypothetical protein
MRNLILTFGFLFCLTQARGQEQKNIEDLDFLYKSIQQTFAYKDQLKDDSSYVQLYQSLRKSLNTSNDFEVYQKLAQLISPLKDNHLAFYHATDSNYKFAYQKPVKDLKALEKKLTVMPKDSIEGIYYSDYQNAYKSLLYKYKPDVYYLQSVQTGYLEAILTKTKFGSFDAIAFVGPPGFYKLIRNVKLSNEVLIGLSLRKTLKKDYRGLGTVDGYFEYKNLNDKTGYLRLSSFNSTEENIKKATEFFNAVKADINQQNLIVDLRSNPGGGFKVSGQFIDYLWKYEGKVYILQNAYTVSNAEQFILNVRARKEVTLLGESTKGTITYGSNNDNRIVLPSKRFVFYPTDMNGLSRHLAFESIGIAPDILLDPFSEDWITQTLKHTK